MIFKKQIFLLQRSELLFFEFFKSFGDSNLLKFDDIEKIIVDEDGTLWFDDGRSISPFADKITLRGISKSVAAPTAVYEFFNDQKKVNFFSFSNHLLYFCVSNMAPSKFEGCEFYLFDFSPYSIYSRFFKGSFINSKDEVDFRMAEYVRRNCTKLIVNSAYIGLPSHFSLAADQLRFNIPRETCEHVDTDSGGVIIIIFSLNDLLLHLPRALKLTGDCGQIGIYYWVGCDLARKFLKNVFGVRSREVPVTSFEKLSELDSVRLSRLIVCMGYEEVVPSFEAFEEQFTNVFWYGRKRLSTKLVGRYGRGHKLYPELLAGLISRQALPSELEPTVVDESSQRDSGDSYRTPLLSIVLLHFNRPHSIGNALESLKSQIESSCELVVIDDGSTPENFELLVNVLSDSKLNYRLVRQPNQYLGSARNTGVSSAKGKFVLFLDDDNQLLDGGLTELLSMIESDGKIDAIAYFSEREGGNISTQSGVPTVSLRYNTVADGNFLVRKDVFERCGGNFEVFAIGRDDFEFFLRFLSAGFILTIIPRPLIFAPSLNHKMRSGQFARNLNDLRVLYAYDDFEKFIEHYRILSFDIFDEIFDKCRRYMRQILMKNPEVKRFVFFLGQYIKGRF